MKYSRRREGKGRYYSLNAKTFSSGPAARTATPAAFAPSHAEFAPSLRPHSVYRCSVEGRNRASPHPGPPQLGTETWRVFKQSRRVRRNEPCRLPETLPHNGAERRRRLPPLAGALPPSRPVGHSFAADYTCVYVPPLCT